MRRYSFNSYVTESTITMKCNRRILIQGACLTSLGMLLAASGSQPARAADLYAYYTRVDSGESFERFARVDQYADVIVKLGSPDGRLVFCRATSYLPYWQTAKGKWPLEEIVPRHGDGTAAMPDRVNLFSHAEIIESSASKVIVHWRYLSSFSVGNPARQPGPEQLCGRSLHDHARRPGGAGRQARDEDHRPME